MWALFIYVLCCFVINLNFCFVSTGNSCELQTTCGECIQNPSVCVWCAHDNFNGSRCKSRDAITSDWCPEQPQDPKASVQPTESGDRDYSSLSGNVIQIKPQNYKILARNGEPVNFTFSFKGAKDYPVDLYFLMDASNSMEKVKDATVAQSEKIYFTMKALTNDVHLGMGSFIEKNVLPFTDRNITSVQDVEINLNDWELYWRGQRKAINLYVKKTTNSSLTYSFKHQLKLVSDFKQFQNTVSATTFGKNRDVPESGLDALAQVIVCNDTIGWRKESRKIVVLLTDAPYHAAGDGRNAGIFEPYDGKCYTRNNMYTKETEMDYPSLPMINTLVTQHEVIVIFFVDHKQDIVYRDLSTVISGSKTANYDNNISEQEETLVKIISSVYEKLTRTIKLKVDIEGGNRQNVQISFDPDCKNPLGSDCDVKKEQEKKFVGTLKVDGVNNISLLVSIEGISEKLALDVEVIKECACENKAVKSDYCHGEPRSCGKCKCGNERYGDRCMCVRHKYNSHNDNSTCISDDNTELCSGHGSCVCGNCQCRDRYTGKYCQCNMDSCPRDPVSGNICNGEDHGKCDCGVCHCNSKWTGKACECSTSKVECMSRNGKECNNRGYCNCGDCKCNPLETWDQRRKQDTVCNIEPCPECNIFQCRYLDNFIACPRNSHKCPEDGVIINTVETLNSSYLNSTEWNLCPDVKVDTDLCYTRYVYKYDDDNYRIILVLQNEKDCVESYLVFGGFFFLTLVLIGLFTLFAWKALTEARDKREYENFVKKQKENNSGPITNPLYEPATTTFRNPAFRKRSIS